jgi:anthranilate phosphoribosyltransferase
VVKHGNRAATSACGSADVLEELGVVIDLPAAGVARTVAEVGIGFCFARVFHPGMRHAGPTRSELGVPTFFNFLGPLTNPGRVTAAAIGCADTRMAPVMAAVLAERGDSALVFRGDDGLDELTTTTTSRVWAVSGGAVTELVVDPERFGLGGGTSEGLRGRDVDYNAEVVRRLVAGEQGPVRDAVLLNAGAALAVHAHEAGEPLDLLANGIERARASVDEGHAGSILARWVEASRSA